MFLEHIAAAARERGIRRFGADVLPSNRKMLTVFQEAGYVVRHEQADGVVRLEFGLAPTATSTAVTQAREQRAEARSVERLLRPRSVAVVGVSRSPHSVGHTVMNHIRASGYTGTTYAVTPHADEVDGVPAYATVTDIPDEVDLAIVAVPAEQVDAVVADCGAKGVRGLVVMSVRLRRDRRGGARSASSDSSRAPMPTGCGSSAQARSACSTPSPTSR